MKIVSPVRTYLLVYLVLMALLVLTVGSAFLDLGRFNTPLNLGIAATKALIVGFFFMHLRTSSGLIKIIATAGIFLLGILFTLGMSDYVSRAWIHRPGRWPVLHVGTENAR
jgi:cytochrome c oxidase subunit 4